MESETVEYRDDVVAALRRCFGAEHHRRGEHPTTVPEGKHALLGVGARRPPATWRLKVGIGDAVFLIEVEPRRTGWDRLEVLAATIAWRNVVRPDQNSGSVATHAGADP
jgi:hypothetical protein